MNSTAPKYNVGDTLVFIAPDNQPHMIPMNGTEVTIRAVSRKRGGWEYGYAATTKTGREITRWYLESQLHPKGD